MESNALRQFVVVSIIVIMTGAGIASGLNSSTVHLNARGTTTQNKTTTLPLSFAKSASGAVFYAQPLSITWDVTVNIHEPGSASDTFAFGEAPDANDGPPADAYDVSKPPNPPYPPYLRIWSNDSLAAPYNMLWMDYRHYPGVSKTWNVFVQWFPSDYSSPTTVTLNWSSNKINTTEYISVLLCNGTGATLRNMLTHNSYTFTCPALVPQLFKIICQANLPPNLPSAPSPVNGTTNVSITTGLSWSGGDPNPGDTVTYDVYFGTSSTPPKVSSNQSSLTYNPGTLLYSTTYHWKIIAWDNHGAKTTGPLWWFKTTAPPNQPPYVPSSPSPSNGAINIPVTADLSWTGGDPDTGDTVTYDVFFGTSTTPPKVLSNTSATTYDPGTLLYSTIYHWKIVAWDNHGASTQGPAWSFTTHVNQPPNTPSNPSPINGASNVSITTDLSWTGGDPDSGDTVTYDVYFGTAATPPKVLSNTSATTYDPGTLLYSTTYHWKIVAWDNHGYSTQGPSWSFTTHVEQPPYTPGNPSPANGATNVSINTDLSWTGGDPDSGDTVTYDVYFGTAATPPKVLGNTSATIYDPGTLLYSTTYHWRIVAWDNHGASTQGPAWSFTTHIEQPPNTPSNPNPANGATNITITTDLSWTGGDPDSGDTVTYDVYFGTAANPPKVLDNTSATTYDPGTLLYGTIYHWKIVAWDNHGYSTPGPTWSFTTIVKPNNPPNKPSNPIPANASHNVSTSIVLHWTGGDPDSGDTVTYDVFFGTTQPLSKLSANQTATSYTPQGLQYNKKYYWRIIAWDNHHASNPSPQWEFSTTTDTIAPGVRITAPESGYLYLNIDDILHTKIRFFTTFVIGKMPCTAWAADNISGVKSVAFYLDDVLKENDTSSPYEWNWNTRGFFFQYTLKVIAYDNAGNTKSDELKAWKLF